MLKRIHSTFKKDDKKHPPPPFPLTRRATESDVGGSKPPHPLRRRPSIHNAQHRLRTLLGLNEEPPPLPPRPMHITGPLEDPRLSRLDDWDDLRLSSWAVGDPQHVRWGADVRELPRPKQPRPLPPHRMHTF